MKYVCSVCGYVYDEEKEDKLFSDLPDTWACPWCKAPKALFKPKEEPAVEKPSAEHEDNTADRVTGTEAGSESP